MNPICPLPPCFGFRTVMLSIDPVSGSDLMAKWFGATIDAYEANTQGLIKDLPGPTMPEVCQSACCPACRENP